MTDKKQYGFGIVGCGMIAEFHAQAIQAMEGGHLACVFSRNIENAKKVAETYNCAAYDNYDAFLKHEGLDIVSIATPTGAHLDPAVKAANAKKHIICEKPIEVTLERVDQVIQACEENGVKLAGIFPRRFNSAVKEFKKAVETNKLGTLTMADAYIKWYRTQEYYDNGEWRGTWKLDGGGALMNQGIHTIDLLYHLAGDVETVSAFATCRIHEGIEVEDLAVATIKFKNGALGVIEGSTACFSPTGHPAEVHLCGSEGSIFMKDNTFTVWQFKDETEKDKAIVEKFKPQDGAVGRGAADPKAISFDGHQRNFEDFIQAINQNSKPAIDGQEARKAIEIILAIYQSASQGGTPVSLPLSASPEIKSFS